MDPGPAARVAGRVRQAPRGEGSGVVAGLQLLSERPLAGCSGGRPVAGRLSVLEAGAAEPGGGFVTAPGEAGSAWLRIDGRRLLLAGAADWGARVRRLAPYASWLQGLPLLHAAAVARRDWAVALIGASGAGKSTLAEHLCSAGHRRLADDLTPCRVRHDGVVVPRSSRSSVPLSALVFLERQPGRRPAVDSLSRAATVCHLARHGWGDLALPELWRAQFAFYVGAAGRCPAVRLGMPDDPARLPDSLAGAARLLAEI